MTTEQKTADEILDIKKEIDHIIESGPNAIRFMELFNRVAKEYARQQCEEFRDWYDALSPADKCTVWPPSGSGSGTGLYNMSTSDIVQKFIRIQAKKKSSILNARQPEI